MTDDEANGDWTWFFSMMLLVLTHGVIRCIEEDGVPYTTKSRPEPETHP